MSAPPQELELLQLRQIVIDLQAQLREVTRDRDRYQLRSRAMATVVGRFCLEHSDDSRVKELWAAFRIVDGKGLNA